MTLASRARAVALLLPLLPLAARPAAAQSMPVGVEVQMPLLLRVLTFDRALPPRGTAFVVAIVFQGRNRASSDAKDAALEAILGDRALRVRGQPLRAELIDLDTDPDVAAALQRTQAGAVYVAPLRGVAVEPIVKAARAARIRTLTGVDAYLAQGIAVSVRIRGDHPRLAINLGACKGEGADYPAQLLSFADVQP